MELAKDRNGLADFILERLVDRYVLPVRSNSHKHGFSMMAVSCLLIETLESYYRGWEDTSTPLESKDLEVFCRPTDPNRARVSASEVAFCYFFRRFSAFSSFQPVAQSFYVNVRCGILHQGETTGGWVILPTGNLLDAGTNSINADRFLKQVESPVKTYATELRNAEWNADPWPNFRKKMGCIICHCQS